MTLVFDVFEVCSTDKKSFLRSSKPDKILPGMFTVLFLTYLQNQRRLVVNPFQQLRVGAKPVENSLDTDQYPGTLSKNFQIMPITFATKNCPEIYVIYRNRIP